MTTTPEVELHAVFRPAVMAMWATRRVVVVLPLVPVMDTTGTVGERAPATGPPGSSARIRSARLGDDSRSTDLGVPALLAEQGGQHRAERLAGEASPVAVAPRDGDDDLVDRGARCGSGR